jgi:ssDNA thymidine ADP-ribosyltransferase, DarT
MKLEDVKLYRITHIENIPHILQHGITHKSSPNANPQFLPIGDLSLIDARNKRIVEVNNGYLPDTTTSTIVLGNLTPFYFGIKMPMLYVIQSGGNFVQNPTPATEIIYLVCQLFEVINLSATYYFTDGHAIDKLTCIYDSSRILDLPELVDWNAVKSAFWGGSDNLNVKRKKQAELLIAGDIPPKLITKFGCFNSDAQQKLEEMGIAKSRIKVVPSAYY